MIDIGRGPFLPSIVATSAPNSAAVMQTIRLSGGPCLAPVYDALSEAKSR